MVKSSDTTDNRPAWTYQIILNAIRDNEFLRNKAKPFSDEWHRADGALFALDDLGVKLFGYHLNKLEHERLGGR